MAFIDAHTSGMPSPGASRHPLPKGEGLTGRGSAREKISIYGQESNYTTWRMARMNLAIRGIEGQIAHGDSFHNDPTSGPEGRLHPRESALQTFPTGAAIDCERTNDGSSGSHRSGNANFAWVQHFLHHLAPRGIAGFVPGQRLDVVEPIRGRRKSARNIIEANLVDCIVRVARTVIPVHADTRVFVVFVAGTLTLTRRFAPPSPKGRGS